MNVFFQHNFCPAHVRNPAHLGSTSTAAIKTCAAERRSVQSTNGLVMHEESFCSANLKCKHESVYRENVISMGTYKIKKKNLNKYLSA